MEHDTAVDALSALAQGSRLAIFRCLVEAGPEGRAAGAIGAALGIPPATLSFHLAQLSRAGLARADRRGRSIVYRADFGAVWDLVTYLTDNCCRGRPEDCAAPVARPPRAARASSP